MISKRQSLQNLYDAFNKREIEKILASMRSDVKWANGMEGGFILGSDNVREYWNRQFEITQPSLEPLKFERDNDNRSVVTVHQIVRDLYGNLLMEKTVRQIFTFEDGLISVLKSATLESSPKIRNASGENRTSTSTASSASSVGFKSLVNVFARVAGGVEFDFRSRRGFDHRFGKYANANFSARILSSCFSFDAFAFVFARKRFRQIKFVFDQNFEPNIGSIGISA